MAQWIHYFCALQLSFPFSFLSSSAYDIILFLFKARIAFLQGERRAQENLKRDLVRRIKMLEYALRQERYHQYNVIYQLRCFIWLIACLKLSSLSGTSILLIISISKVYYYISRQKYHKLRYGTELKMLDINDDAHEEESELSGSNENLTKANNFNYRQGRQILRQ